MKKRILLSAMGLLGLTMSAQSVPGSVAMGAGYANQVYYKLSNQATNSYPSSSWDIAFNRQSAFDIGIRSNDHKGISVFEASADLNDWATIDVTQEATWTHLYNSETAWETGSFDSGSATYGWGEYNSVTHHVYGTVIFVLKYADATYKKLRIDDFWGGYTFTYSSWDGTAWSADTTTTVANSTNTTQLYNYFSLQDNAAVVAEPASTDWDFVFTKYLTDIMGDGSMMYSVTGALHHKDIQVAQNDEANGTDTSALEYSADINTIGYDWKTFNMGTFTYDVNSDMAFYVKYLNGTVYRLVFNTFEGSSTGVITFNSEDVTDQLSTVDQTAVTFGVFPNPSRDKKINIVYDAASSTAKNSINIYNLNGSKVYASELASAGFNNTSVDLTSLSSGVYVLEFVSGDFKEVKKIVLQ
ncbi:T9SS type A sorting domain-containing protein [Flavobacterium silvaticum]|uniref:T9SS type A sorting domain-containing protein n=1 Tax=Flavobacterium silvaticum TaxID=1852020 RepID=A0A972FXN5_9FLAO|nr:T9SS type A sorting domain-containing protein [Flavobacterium silvaticum]NMH29540.1 T9SS type A sorting domain-containing protein [Flavobacterium silvaticum]